MVAEVEEAAGYESHDTSPHSPWQRRATRGRTPAHRAVSFDTVGYKWLYSMNLDTTTQQPPPPQQTKQLHIREGKQINPTQKSQPITKFKTAKRQIKRKKTLVFHFELFSVWMEWNGYNYFFKNDVGMIFLCACTQDMCIFETEVMCGNARLVKWIGNELVLVVKHKCLSL